MIAIFHGYTVGAYVSTHHPALSMAQHPSRKSPKPNTSDDQNASDVRISVLLTKDERQRLKVMAAERGVTISEVVRQGIARFLEGAS